MRKILTTVILCLAAQLVHAQSNYDVSDWAEFDSKAHGHSGETNPAPQLTDGDLITLKGNITFGHNVRISQNDCSGGSDLFTYPTGITINGDNNNYDLDLNGYSLQGNDTLNLNNLNVENGTVMIGDSTAAGAPGGTITLTNTDWDNATISGAGNVVIGNDTAPSTTTFNGVNTYTGTTTIGGLATMNVNASGALNSTQSVTVKGTLNTYSTTQTIQSLAGNVNGRLNNDGDLTVRAGTWQGIINGVGSLNVDGNFTIGGNQSQNYTGATTVSSGTLRLNVANAIVNSSGVSVSSGATLSAIHGANVKSVTLQSGAVLQVELDPTSAALNTETVVRVGSGASLVADLGGQPLGVNKYDTRFSRPIRNSTGTTFRS